jgi:hypothetical protein
MGASSPNLQQSERTSQYPALRLQTLVCHTGCNAVVIKIRFVFLHALSRQSHLLFIEILINIIICVLYSPRHRS